MAKMRLFTAINFSENTKQNLCKTVDNMKSMGISANYTVMENLHLTLVFLGETDKAELVKKAMDNIDVPSFELEFESLGVFKRPIGDIVWIGIKNNSILTELYRKLICELELIGFKPEYRSYNPHITLARKAIISSSEVEDLSNSFNKVSESVERISLMKSERIGGELIYTEIFAKRLT